MASTQNVRRFLRSSAHWLTGVRHLSFPITVIQDNSTWFVLQRPGGKMIDSRLISLSFVHHSSLCFSRQDLEDRRQRWKLRMLETAFSWVNQLNMHAQKNACPITRPERCVRGLKGEGWIVLSTNTCRENPPPIQIMPSAIFILYLYASANRTLL